jgi:hypothetical protein
VDIESSLSTFNSFKVLNKGYSRSMGRGWKSALREQRGLPGLRWGSVWPEEQLGPEELPMFPGQQVTKELPAYREQQLYPEPRSRWSWVPALEFSARVPSAFPWVGCWL